VEIEIRASFCDPDSELLAVFEIAGGGYEQMIDFALGLSHGVFT
jgi:hypothetical protein